VLLAGDASGQVVASIDIREDCYLAIFWGLLGEGRGLGVPIWCGGDVVQTGVGGSRTKRSSPAIRKLEGLESWKD
jgi:hypothetical protein